MQDNDSVLSQILPSQNLVSTSLAIQLQTTASIWVRDLGALLAAANVNSSC